MTESRWIDRLGFAAWALLTAALTLTPAPGGPLTVRPLCLLCGELGGADFVRNVLLFAPAGFFLGRSGRSVIVVTGLGLAMSTGIELTQLVVPGRYVTLRDILTNGIGAGAGAVFFHAMRYGLQRASGVMLAAAALLPVGVVALTGWLMQPVGTDDIYFAQWVPKRTYYAPWDGRILHADVDGIEARNGLLEEGDAVRDALLASRPVHLRLVAADPPASLSALFHIVDEFRREILMIGASGNTLVIRPRLRANEARLDFTDQRLEGFFDGIAAGDTVALTVTTDAQGRSCASTDRFRRCADAPSLGAAWQVILYKGVWPRWARRTMHGVTVLLLLLPLGILAQRRSRRTRLTVLGATLIALVVVGRSFGLAWPGVPELAAFALVVLLPRPWRGPGPHQG